MTFNGVQLNFLHRLLLERPPTRKCSGAAKFFHEHYSIGTLVSGSVYYKDADFTNAQNLLRSSDLPMEPLDPAARRTDAAMHGGMSEKLLSAAPHSDAIAIKVHGACALDGATLASPGFSYLVLTHAEAARISCDRLMIVENFETFRALNRYSWIDYQGHNVMVVFRGDNIYKNDDAKALLDARAEPLWAFFDFDPSGLVLANALPKTRLERMVLPGPEALRRAAGTETGRALYGKQLAQSQKTLDAAANPIIQKPWQLMKALRCGVTQERMISIATEKEIAK